MIREALVTKVFRDMETNDRLGIKKMPRGFYNNLNELERKEVVQRYRAKMYNDLTHLEEEKKGGEI